MTLSCKKSRPFLTFISISLTLEPGKFSQLCLKPLFDVMAACKLVAPKTTAKTAALNTFFIFDPFIFDFQLSFG